MGFEPTTASLEGWNSTTELRPPTENLPTLQTCRPYPAWNKSAHCHITYFTIIILQPPQADAIRFNVVGRQGFEPWKP